MTQIRIAQALAVMNAEKTKYTAETSNLHHCSQKPDLVNGFVKTYQKLDDADVDRHPEFKRVQLNLDDAIAAVIKGTSAVSDTVATRDYGNTIAKANVVVNGTTLIADAPPTLLMFLAKQVEDLRTFVEKLVTLDQSHDWKKNPSTNLWNSNESKTNSTAKTQASLMLVPPTDKHPGQAVQITKDTVVGTWTTVNVSGAIEPTRKLKLLERLDVIGKAINEALNECNSQKVDRQEGLTTALFAFINA